MATFSVLSRSQLSEVVSCPDPHSVYLGGPPDVASDKILMHSIAYFNCMIPLGS